MNTFVPIERHVLLFIAIATLIGGGWFLLSQGGGTHQIAEPKPQIIGQDVIVDSTVTKVFEGFTVDATRRTVELEALISGGPGKDEIPALRDPSFEDALESPLRKDDLGVFIETGGMAKFYPYRILVWHEVVNDDIGGTPIAVTFCPLCGSAIVFHRTIGSNELEFGVSGLLYESNMVMFDRSTESFWSQSRGEGIVGAYAGVELEHYPMQVLTFQEAWDRSPNLQVMSLNTGYERNYNFDPYSSYNDEEDLLFPVSITDKRFPAKTVMYAFRTPVGGVAIPVESLMDGMQKTASFWGQEYSVSKEDGEIYVESNGERVPGYYEMWFSWAIHHQGGGKVWE